MTINPMFVAVVTARLLAAPAHAGESFYASLAQEVVAARQNDFRSHNCPGLGIHSLCVTAQRVITLGVFEKQSANGIADLVRHNPDVIPKGADGSFTLRPGQTLIVDPGL